MQRLVGLQRIRQLPRAVVFYAIICNTSPMSTLNSQHACMHACMHPSMRHTAYASFNIHTIHTPTGDSIVFARLETTLQTLVLHTFRKYNILLSHSLTHLFTVSFSPPVTIATRPIYKTNSYTSNTNPSQWGCGDVRVTCQKWSPYSNNTAKPNKQAIP